MVGMETRALRRRRTPGESILSVYVEFPHPEQTTPYGSSEAGRGEIKASESDLRLGRLRKPTNITTADDVISWRGRRRG